MRGGLRLCRRAQTNFGLTLSSPANVFRILLKKKLPETLLRRDLYQVSAFGQLFLIGDYCCSLALLAIPPGTGHSASNGEALSISLSQTIIRFQVGMLRTPTTALSESTAYRRRASLDDEEIYMNRK